MSPPSKCVWCDDPVPKDGDTCSFHCYEMWYAWYERTAEIVGGSKLLFLRECEQTPKPLDEQPWYRRMMDGKEG